MIFNSIFANCHSPRTPISHVKSFWIFLRNMTMTLPLCAKLPNDCQRNYNSLANQFSRNFIFRYIHEILVSDTFRTHFGYSPCLLHESAFNLYPVVWAIVWICHFAYSIQFRYITNMITWKCTVILLNFRCFQLRNPKISLEWHYEAQGQVGFGNFWSLCNKLPIMHDYVMAWKYNALANLCKWNQSSGFH